MKFPKFKQIKPSPHNRGCMECENKSTEGIVYEFVIGYYNLRLCAPCLRRLFRVAPAEIK
jgi:hypothetical protein